MADLSNLHICDTFRDLCKKKVTNWGWRSDNLHIIGRGHERKKIDAHLFSHSYQWTSDLIICIKYWLTRGRLKTFFRLISGHFWREKRTKNRTKNGQKTDKKWTKNGPKNDEKSSTYLYIFDEVFPPCILLGFHGRVFCLCANFQHKLFGPRGCIRCPNLLNDFESH